MNILKKSNQDEDDIKSLPQNIYQQIQDSLDSKLRIETIKQIVDTTWNLKIDEYGNFNEHMNVDVDNTENDVDNTENDVEEELYRAKKSTTKKLYFILYLILYIYIDNICCIF